MTSPMPLRRSMPWVLALAACVVVCVTTPAARQAATSSPLLWEGRHGSARIALFGTIHVPDARVLALPPRVRSAFDAADHVVTEIPLDPASQARMAGALLLPDGQRLRAIIGEARFARLENRVRTAVAPRAPALAPLLVGMLDRLKPWAALAQLAALDYLPDLLEGKVALDAQLYADAQAAGKHVGGLETVAEQAGTFDAFTPEEQVALLDAALAELERPGDGPSAATIVQWYLAGDVEQLVTALAHTPGDAALARKFEHEVLVARNHRMAERIDVLRRQAPTASLFIAVGALHLVGRDNVPQLLADRGYDITRVRP